MFVTDQKDNATDLRSGRGRQIRLGQREVVQGLQPKVVVLDRDAAEQPAEDVVRDAVVAVARRRTSNLRVRLFSNQFDIF